MMMIDDDDDDDEAVTVIYPGGESVTMFTSLEGMDTSDECTSYLRALATAPDRSMRERYQVCMFFFLPPFVCVSCITTLIIQQQQ